MKRHYRVGSETFVNPYAALRQSAKTGEFAELHVDNKQCFLDIDVRKLGSHKELISEKAQYLNSNYRCRFHYSGGYDSHTIVDQAKWPMHYMYLRGLIDVRHVDEEYMFGYDYIQEQNLPAQIKYITLEDYEIWKDPEAPYTHNDWYYGVCPTWVSGYALYQNPDPNYDLEITGMEKPWLYKKDDDYYWLVNDCSDMLVGHNRVDFFIDDYYPELAVKQVYTVADYFRRVYPDAQGFIQWKETDQDEILRHMGRNMNRLAQPVNKSMDFWWANHQFNYKHRRTVQELETLGRKDIVKDWIAAGQRLIEDCEAAPHGIRVVEKQLEGYGTVRMPSRVNRFGAIYKLHERELELLDHTDVNEL